MPQDDGDRIDPDRRPENFSRSDGYHIDRTTVDHGRMSELILGIHHQGPQLLLFKIREGIKDSINEIVSGYFRLTD